MISEKTLEQRIRRGLAKHGMKLHKVRGENRCYITDEKDPKKERVFSSLYDAWNYVGELEEKRKSKEAGE